MMKNLRVVAVLGLGLMVAAPLVAQGVSETNRRQTRTEIKQQEKIDKQQAKANQQQAKADKATRKALNTKQAKRAAKAQDKANAMQPQ